ncbi:MAG TPA: malate synthase G, partial [Saliniramus sp.]|nr:malate synthase G [Saliniramus sp.]
MSAQNTANDRITVHGLGIDKALHGFIKNEALPGTGIAPDAFWSGFSALIHDFGPRNRELLDKRAAMQKEIDDWHRERRGKPFDLPAYKQFLA